MTEILKKPVHVALLRTTHVQKLVQQGKFVPTPYGVEPAIDAKLPSEPKKSTTPSHLVKLPSSDIVKKTKKRVQLNVIHNQVAPIPEERTPPCGSCKTSACCYVFAVNITELEYESGLYGDAAVKITPEMQKQFQSYNMLPLGMPRVADTAGYFLEGKIGEPCPFLTPDAKCGIYEIRPITCRVYSCVGDSRITEDMRQGKEPLDTLALVTRRIQEDAK
ncbi:YkgJ family cysteine cluster protein [bacterium]|nr:YkgJ family cysteine cluster protein [bacterium]